MMLRVFSLLVLAAAAFLLIAYFGMRHHLISVSNLRLDPLGESYIAHQTFQKRYDLVLIGDSRAYHWATDAEVNVVKLASPGATTKQTAILYELYAEEVAADVALIQTGVNDLKYIAFDSERADDIIEDCIQNLEMIVDQALRNNSEVVISTIFPTARPPLHRKPFWDPAVERAIATVNTWIENRYGRAEDRVRVLHANRILKGDDGYVKREYVLDFMHINAAGYQELGRSL